MKNILIKINELKINNYDRNNDRFNLNILIDVNGEKESLKKEYKIDKGDILSRDLINYVKEYVKSKNKISLPSNNIIENVVIVRFNGDLEELEEKISGFFKRFNDLVKNWKNRGYSENYLMTYKTVDGFSQRF